MIPRFDNRELGALMISGQTIGDVRFVDISAV
jgi:hypothetical protein